MFERAHVRVVTNTDYPALEKVAESAIKERQKFERLLVSKENLLEMFSVRQYIKVVHCHERLIDWDHWTV